MMTLALRVTAALPLVGCASPPGVDHFDKTWAVESDYDRTWSAIIEVFAENRWAITTLENDSGLI